MSQSSATQTEPTETSFKAEPDAAEPEAAFADEGKFGQGNDCLL